MSPVRRRTKTEGRTRVAPKLPTDKSTMLVSRKIRRLTKRVERLSRMKGAPPVAFVCIQSGKLTIHGSKELCEAIVGKQGEALLSVAATTVTAASLSVIEPKRDSQTLDLKGVPLSVNWAEVGVKQCRVAYSQVIFVKGTGERNTYHPDKKPDFWPALVPFCSHSKPGAGGKGRAITPDAIRMVLCAFQRHCAQKILDGVEVVNSAAGTDAEKLHGQACNLLQLMPGKDLPSMVLDYVSPMEDIVEFEVEADTQIPDVGSGATEALLDEIDIDVSAEVLDNGPASSPSVCSRNLPQLVSKAEALLQELQVPSCTKKYAPGRRWHVCGEVLEAADFDSLLPNSWLTDKVINAYLHLLMEQTNIGAVGHVYPFPSYTAVLWDENNYSWHGKVKLMLYNWILLPINIKDEHWMLLAANVCARTVSILDSFRAQTYKKERSHYLKKFRQYMEDRSARLGEDRTEWTIGDMKSGTQSDGSSCGPFVMLNALAITRGIVTDGLGQECAVAMRNYVRTSLEQHAKEPPAQRSTCDMIDCNRPRKRQTWAQCDVCGRWCHFSCVDLTIHPAGYYVCPICIAQYN